MSGTFNINQINVNVTDVIPPDNFATVDAGAKIGSVYTKEQDNAWRKEVEENTTSGIKGIAKPDDTVPTTGFFRMLANTADTYTNYLDINDAPIIVSDADLNVVNSVQRNEVIIEVTNGVAEKKVFAKVGADGANGTATIPQWVAGDYSPNAMVLKDLVQYIAPNGATATDIPSGESNIWKSIGGKVESVFDDQNQNNGASMNATAKYINERFGVEIKNNQSNVKNYTKNDVLSSYGSRLSPSNIVLNTGGNGYILHNIPLNGASKIIVNGFILKDTGNGYAGILGVKSDGQIIDLTASLSDYAQLTNQSFDVSEFTNFSASMPAEFSIKVFSEVYEFPKISDYFELKRIPGFLKRVNRFSETDFESNSIYTLNNGILSMKAGKTVFDWNTLHENSMISTVYKEITASNTYFGINSQNPFGQHFSLFVKYNNAGKIEIFKNDLTSVSLSSSSNTNYVVGDLLKIDVSREHLKFSFKIINITKGWSIFHELQLQPDGSTAPPPNSSKPAYIVTSGEISIYNYSVRSLIQHVEKLIAGDSITSGGIVTNQDLRYGELVNGNNLISGGSSDVTQSVLSRMAEIKQTMPIMLLSNIGGNDILYNVADNIWKENLREIRRQTIDASIEMVWLLTTPRAGANQINEFIKTEPEFITDLKIDLNTPMCIGGNPEILNPIYDFGDGVHPNNAGHAKMAEIINNII